MINIKGAVVRRGHFLDYIDLLKVKSSVLSYNSKIVKIVNFKAKIYISWR